MTIYAGAKKKPQFHGCIAVDFQYFSRLSGKKCVKGRCCHKQSASGVVMTIYAGAKKGVYEAKKSGERCMWNRVDKGFPAML